MRAWLGVLLVGCSSVTPFPSDDIANFDGGPTFDSTIPKEASTFDVVDEDAKPFNGGGPFTCHDCTCDGTLNYCLYATGGHMPIADGGADDAASDAAPACDPDASACMPIPIECLPKPTCACVMQYVTCPLGGCSIDPTGNGIVFTCEYPP